MLHTYRPISEAFRFSRRKFHSGRGLYLPTLSRQTYEVALITRGGGAYTYTYGGPADTGRGQLCAVSFRSKLELGVVVDCEPDAEPQQSVLPLVPLAVSEHPQWGGLLCDIAELCEATPREVAGHLLFDAPARGMQLYLELGDGTALSAKLRGELAALAGRLTPTKRKRLMQVVDWKQLAAFAEAQAITMHLEITGATANSRQHSKLANYYELDSRSAGLLALPRETPPLLSGSYLAGLQDHLEFPWPVVRRRDMPDDAAVPSATAPPGELKWEPVALPADWDLCRRWPAIAELQVRRASATWRELRDSNGLVADVVSDAVAGRAVLLLAPMGWMLERLWPGLGPWAGQVHRHCVDAGPSAAAVVLKALRESGQIVSGLEGSWKLAAYGDFDRVVVIDPSHPYFKPDGEPWLDVRQVLLLTLAGRACALDFIDMGMSSFDGRNQLAQVSLLAPHEPAATASAQGRVVDINPLPLKLRQPERRRLVYFNRLGQSRGLRCVECNTAVHCPHCSSVRLYYSPAAHGYRCSACGLAAADLRCRVCGTAQLAAEYPGLEAIDRRSGDALIHGARARRLAHAEHQSVVGTVQLLEPVTEFWPQEVIYIHPDARGGALDDWPQALDMLARLNALYANPHLEGTYIISSRLVEQLGTEIDAERIVAEYAQELTLRRLAGLPPYGRLLRFRLRGPDARLISEAGREVLDCAKEAGGAGMGWLGRPYARRGELQASGYFSASAGIKSSLLQQLRAELGRRRIRMSIQVEWGPWL